MNDPEFRKPNLVDLQDDGVLWMINRLVFHPRGFALGIIPDGKGGAAGFELYGDGLVPWQFATEAHGPGARAIDPGNLVDEADLLARFERALDRARANPGQ